MNRRADERIAMKLSCGLSFPGFWQNAVPGVTANLHRSGILVACDLSAGVWELPPIGEPAMVRVALPANPSFKPKCIEFTGRLLRIRNAGLSEVQFAVRIERVRFSERSSMPPPAIDIQSASSPYIV